MSDFAGGVRGESQWQVLGVNSASVVSDSDELFPAIFDFYVDFFCACVEAVFQEFLNDAGGPFDDFAGGDSVDQVLG